MAEDLTVTIKLSEESVAVIERLIAAIQADIESRESRTVEIEVDSFGAGYAPDTT